MVLVLIQLASLTRAVLPAVLVPIVVGAITISFQLVLLGGMPPGRVTVPVLSVKQANLVARLAWEAVLFVLRVCTLLVPEVSAAPHVVLEHTVTPVLPVVRTVLQVHMLPVAVWLLV